MSLSVFYIRDLKLQGKVSNSTCRTISVCKIVQIVNFDGLTFLTALVLFNQSDYLNHFNMMRLKKVVEKE